MNARQHVAAMIAQRAGTSEADARYTDAAIDLILSVSHVRKCWNCGNVGLHRDNITPYVLCAKCGSQDTRLSK